jgi:hypothetical protein
MRVPLTVLLFAGIAADAGSSRLVAQGAPPPTSPPPTSPPPSPQAVFPPRFPAPKPAMLAPLADSIANFLTFAPAGNEWFTAAVRNRRLLLDVGRVDTEVRRDSARAAGYREAVEKRSTVPIGATFRLRGPWGAEDVTAAAVEVWNGRIALRLAGSESLDSMVRATASLVVSAQRIDKASAPASDSCDRKTPLAAPLVARMAFVRDSVETALRAGAPPPGDRLRRAMVVKASQVQGCFGGAKKVALLVSLRAGDNEWSRERIVLVDTLGKAFSLRVNDYRFRSHDLLAAFDADGDGVDDLVTRASTQRAGGTTILVLDFRARRANRLSSGFVWEEQ